jgi:hypothetical protein
MCRKAEAKRAERPAEVTLYGRHAADVRLHDPTDSR